MSLSVEIESLRDRVLAELNSAHDYFTDTKTAWRLVDQFVASGFRMTNRNTATGSMTTEVELTAKARGYVAEQLTQATFQQFLAIFESFVFDLLRLWLTTYPQSLGGKMLDFRSVLDAPDKDAITQLVVRKELNEILYDRPAGGFAYLNDKVKLGCPSTVEVEKITEAKASRDVLAHNRGVASKIYEAKAGKLARYKIGDAIDISEPYHRETWELIRKIVADVSNAAIAKAP